MIDEMLLEPDARRSQPLLFLRILYCKTASCLYRGWVEMKS